METRTCEYAWRPIKRQEGWFAGRWRTLRTRAYGILSDEILVRRARAQDHMAFDALVARYRRRLYALALDALGNEAEAGAALRETVISIFRHIDSIGEKCAPGTWIFLHGFRTVLKRMNIPPGKYTVRSRLTS